MRKCIESISKMDLWNFYGNIILMNEETPQNMHTDTFRLSIDKNIRFRDYNFANDKAIFNEF